MTVVIAGSGTTVSAAVVTDNAIQNPVCFQCGLMNEMPYYSRFNVLFRSADTTSADAALEKLLSLTCKLLMKEWATLALPKPLSKIGGRGGRGLLPATEADMSPLGSGEGMEDAREERRTAM